MKKINSYIFELAVFFAANIIATYPAQAKITITSPKAESWLLPMDDDRTIAITGNTSNLPSGTELKLSIDRQRTKKPQTWKTKLSKSGSYTFEIDQYLIYPNNKTTLTVEAIKDGAVIETEKQTIFCCSTEVYGVFKELTPGSEQVISVSQPGTDIDGMRLTIPKKATIGTKNPRVIITVQQDQMRDVPLDKYTPLNSAIDIDLSDFTSISGIKYSLRAQPNIPRIRGAQKADPESWESFAERPWKDIDLAKSKIIILAYDPNDQIWKEVKPSKMLGNDVEFTLPEDHVFNRFLPAAKFSPKK
jgi:hypothetical protein